MESGGLMVPVEREQGGLSVPTNTPRPPTNMTTPLAHQQAVNDTQSKGLERLLQSVVQELHDRHADLPVTISVQTQN